MCWVSDEIKRVGEVGAMSPKTSTDAAPLRVVFFGDSICFGQGVSTHDGWVTRLSAFIEALAGRSGWDSVVVNASVNGNTTRQALERMPYDVQSQGVDVLLVQFGLNDCNHWDTDNGVPRVSPHAFSANLHEIIDRGVRFGARRVLLNTNHPTTRDSDIMAGGEITYEQNNRFYNTLVRDVVEARADVVELIDIATVFDNQLRAGDRRLDQLLLPDGLHLSRAGHTVYFEAVAPRIETVINNFATPSRELQQP